jgi:ATP-dependent DNA helicase RecQ
VSALSPANANANRSFGLREIEDILARWPQTLEPGILEFPTEAPVLDRVQQVLRSGVEGELCWTDLAPLLRQFLLGQKHANGIARLRVRDGDGCPPRAFWERFGFSTISVEESGLVIEPVAWRPGWLPLPGDSSRDIFHDTFAGRHVRKNAAVPIDPFIEEVTGYPTYLCPGQREAVRSALFMRPGSTLVVNLPTGAGKTLVGQTPVLLHGIGSGLTLFVVPTKALALDLARRMRELLLRRRSDHEIPSMVWHGGIDDDTRAIIKRNIRAGEQGILFAMPEAVTGPLLPALHDAAAGNLLRYMVVDEAHMVAQWGDDFRPAFQLLSGVRRGLLARCPTEPFRTLLMSATLNRVTLDTLDALFGPAEQVEMVAAVHLRPEPRYWVRRAADRSEQRQYVLELLRHVPRPFILYVTEPKFAKEWLRLLKSEGFERIATFHGQTGNNEREVVIDQWANDELDGLVATSAFGVGMDKQDVPTIIHAVLPETLDRYYQEVGRGGRGGTASISVVVYTDRDVQTARSLSQPTLLTGDIAYERWTTMYRSRTVLGDGGLLGVDLSAVPQHLRQQGDYNTSWNMRTLILLARARAIELDSMPLGRLQQEPAESAIDYDRRLSALFEEYSLRVPLRTLDARHLERSHFESVVLAERERGLQHAEAAFEDLLAAIEGRREMGAILAGLYADQNATRSILVSQVCRGCPADPYGADDNTLTYRIPVGIGISRVVVNDLSPWLNYFPELPASCSVILFPPTQAFARELQDALMILVSLFGVQELVAKGEAFEREPILRNLYRSSPGRALVSRKLSEESLNNALPLFRATLLWPWRRDAIPAKLFALERPLHVILAPSDVESDHPLRIFADTSTNSTTLEGFLRVARQ